MTRIEFPELYTYTLSANLISSISCLPMLLEGISIIDNYISETASAAKKICMCIQSFFLAFTADCIENNNVNGYTHLDL